MRGGTANCTVVLSEEEIGSPIIERPLSLIVMNRPSLDKFQPRLKNGGIQIVNSSLVDPKLVEKGNRIRTVLVPANELADTVGNARAVNTIMLGAYVAATGMVKLETVEGCLSAVMPPKIVPLNITALRAGAQYALEQLKASAPVKAAAKAPAKAAAKPAAKKKTATRPAVKAAPTAAPKAAAKKKSAGKK